MTQHINITISDYVYEQIIEGMIKDKKTNRSEYIEELIRIGLIEKK